MKPGSMWITLGMSLFVVLCAGTITPTSAGAPTQANPISVPAANTETNKSTVRNASTAGAPVPSVEGFDMLGAPVLDKISTRFLPTIGAHPEPPETFNVDSIPQDPLQRAARSFIWGSADGDPTDSK